MAVYFKKSSSNSSAKIGDFEYKRTNVVYDDYVRLDNTELNEDNASALILEDEFFKAGDKLLNVENETVNETASVSQSAKYSVCKLEDSNKFYAFRINDSLGYETNEYYLDPPVYWRDWSNNNNAHISLYESENGRDFTEVEDTSIWLNSYKFNNQNAILHNNNNIFVMMSYSYLVAYDLNTMSYISSKRKFRERNNITFLDAHYNKNIDSFLFFVSDFISDDDSIKTISVIESKDLFDFETVNVYDYFIPVSSDENFQSNIHTAYGSHPFIIADPNNNAKDGSMGNCYYRGNYYMFDSDKYNKNKVYIMNENNLVYKEIFDYTHLLEEGFIHYANSFLPTISENGKFAGIIGNYSDSIAVLVSKDLKNFEIKRYSIANIDTETANLGDYKINDYFQNFNAKVSSISDDSFLITLPERNISSITNDFFESEFKNTVHDDSIDLRYTNFIYNDKTKEVIYYHRRNIDSSDEEVNKIIKQEVVKMNTDVVYRTPDLTANDLKFGDVSLYVKSK